jgi:hypothetical protein
VNLRRHEKCERGGEQQKMYASRFYPHNVLTITTRRQRPLSILRQVWAGDADLSGPIA